MLESLNRRITADSSPWMSPMVSKQNLGSSKDLQCLLTIPLENVSVVETASPSEHTLLSSFRRASAKLLKKKLSRNIEWPTTEAGGCLHRLP